MRNHFQAQRKGENFPVAGVLLPPNVRKNTLLFYDFVRGMDNIADAADKHPNAREQDLQQATTTPPDWAMPYIAACDRGDINPSYGNQLLRAFKQDCNKTSYENWQDLMGYCELSAVPVGRFMLEQFGEDQANLKAADALCCLLQILNHLQDIKEDYLQLKRIYIPQDMMTQYGVDNIMLTRKEMSPQLRNLTDAILKKCDVLLQQSIALPASISSWRLRFQLRWVINISSMLVKQLRQRDILKQRVKLSRWCYIRALWQ